MSTETPAKPEKKNYKQTLNLPQTAFPMEAKLVANEPKRLAKWQEANLYQQVLDARAGAPRWVLHDGPPFANGDIHIGHVINKTLKDVFIRFKTMQGFQTPYVPGWDCHGLPIEHKISQDLGPKLRQMSTVDVRKLCYDYAEKYCNIQSTQFQRLGILGDWSHPYKTMTKDYEQRTLEVFARFVENGLVYKQLKPVHWSIANQTALAEAELEYKDVEDTSVFVEFPVANPGATKAQFDLRLNVKLGLLIWTTTPWTLPANLAIAVHPEVEYAFVKYKRNQDWHVSVVAAALVERVFSNRGGVSDVSTVKTVPGRELVGLEYRHPFVERTGKVLPADYVTTTDGTGLVHTAPGHGQEDYATGMAHGLEVYCPVLANGRFDSTTPNWLTGLTVWEGNPKVVEKLKELDVLFAEEKLVHSYPHDWRSKTPTIFRATEQWFAAMDKAFAVRDEPRSLRQRASAAVSGEVAFFPEWGRNRFAGMIENRPDWVLSRQRAWGLPIPVFFEKDGSGYLLSAASVRAVAKQVGEHGSNVWFTAGAGELLSGYDAKSDPDAPQWLKDAVGAGTPLDDALMKGKDIFDVWFESGSSWHAVLQARESELKYPADLYLEGSDQHRGWFQLSMLPSLAFNGVPPFRQVLTHGFVVKPDGKKVSKSDKEYVTATQEIERHGADLLRLWTCSVDYEGDIPTSPQVIKEFGDKYRKIRNTVRYLLSNLYDFDPSADAVEPSPNSLDGWALAELDRLIVETTAAYDAFQTHRAFKLLHDFCNVQISAVYGNAMKDRLYCEVPSSPLRRRCQTVMHRMAMALIKLLAPMAVFTADEAWEHLKRSGEEAGLSSVHLALLPKPAGVEVTDEQQAEWKLLMELRDSALQQLDNLKKEVGLNKALDAEIIYQVDDDAMRQKLQAYGPDLEDLAGAGFSSFAERGADAPAVSVRVLDRREKYSACARSWKRRPDVGTDPEYPDLSLRDAQAVRAAGQK